MESGATAKGLPSLLTAARHHAVAMLLGLGVVFGGALAYTSTTVPLYTSHAVMLLSPAAGNPLTPEETTSSSRLTVAMETEAGLVTTPAITDLTSDAVGRKLPADGESLRASVPSGTQMLRLTFTSTSGEHAREGAQAFAETYLAYRQDRATDNQALRIERLQDQAAAAETSLQEAVASSTEEGNVFSEREVEIYTDRLAQLNAEIGAVQVETTLPGRIITPAEAPSGPDGIQPAFILGAAAIGGLILGVLLAVFLEWRQDLVRDDDQFDVSGVPIFATLPRRSTQGLLSRDSQDDAASHEAYRRVRAGVVANGPRPHVLAVAPIGEHEHATAAVSNLAVVLSEAGFSVLLVSADPRTHEIEKQFSIPESPGLADVLQDGMDAAEILQFSEGVSILPAGADPLSARELYGGQALRSVIDQFRAQFDYILIAASGTGTADGDAAIGVADSVLLSITNSRTTHAAVSAALDRFSRLRIETLGAVNVPPSAQQPSRKAAHTTRKSTRTRTSAPENSRARA